MTAPEVNVVTDVEDVRFTECLESWEASIRRGNVMFFLWL